MTLLAERPAKEKAPDAPHSVELRFTYGEWQRILEIAKREHRSGNSMILVLIEEALAAREPRA